MTLEFKLSEEEIELLPTDEDVAFYNEHGWYLSKKLLTDDETDELVNASERYYAGERDRTSRRPRRSWPTGIRRRATSSGTTTMCTTSTTAWPRSSASR